MMKRIISLVLVFALVFSLMQLCPYISAESTNIWDGTSQTKPSGSGTEAAPYLISNGAELAWYINLYNEWKGSRYARLTSDIYLNDITKINWQTGEVTDSGYTARTWLDSTKIHPDGFLGNIDGDGHIIYGMYYNNSASTANVGLVSSNKYDYSVSILNLGIDKAYISTGGDTGAIMARAGTKNNVVENCFVGKDVTIKGTNAAAAVNYAFDFTVRNFYSLATVTGTSSYGVIGDSWSNGDFVREIENVYAVGIPITTKGSIACRNVYSDNIKGGSGAVKLSLENMQGLDALTNSDKMSGLAASDAFVATSGYPELKTFYKGDSGESGGGDIEEEETPRFDIPYIGEDFIYGDVKYSTDFDEFTVGVTPSGWEKGYNGNGASYGWAGSSPSVVAKVVDNATYGKVLDFNSLNCDAFAVLPEIDTPNYIYEANVVVNHSSGSGSSFGITNGMWGGLSASDGTMYLAVYTNSASGKPYYSYRGGTTTKTEFTLPEGSSLPKTGEKVNLKLMNYNGMGYFFYNGTYIAKIPNRSGSAGSDWVGFFTCGGDILVTDVNVREILPESQISVDNEVGDTYIADISSVSNGELPSEIEVSSGSEASVVTDETFGKAIEFSGASDGGFLTFPKISARNYVFEANVVVSHESSVTSPVGTAFNMWNSADKSEGGAVGNDGGVYTSLYTNDTAVSPSYTYIQGNETSYKHSLKIYAPNTGEKLNIRVVSYKGFSYIYYNGLFSVVIEQRPEDNAEDWVGLYTKGGKILVLDAEVQTYLTYYDGFEEVKTKVSYCDRLGTSGNGSNSIKLNASLDESNEIYQNAVNKKFGFVVKIFDGITEGNFTVSDSKSLVLPAEINPVTNDGLLKFSVEITGLSDKLKDSFFNVRAFMSAEVEGKTVYYYSPVEIMSPASVAEEAYNDALTDDRVKKALDKIYKNTAKFKGENMSRLNFTMFADLHYKEGMYIASVADLESILERANDNNSDFVLSAGDFSNDFAGSPELTKAFKDNKYGLKIYNIYGNHELETSGNTMANVTPELTNDSDVIWGTADGKIGDGSVGYYYFDKNGFRIINLDTNYSYNISTEQWEHNLPASWGSPSGNIHTNSLGPVQLEWLENVLFDAAKDGLKCIVNSHRGFSSNWANSPDSNAVRDMYSRVNNICGGTVMLSISGDLHTNRSAVIDNVLYLDINTVRNGWWQDKADEHYTLEDTFKKVSYDADGNPIETNDYSLKYLSGGAKTWFFAEPLSAVININSNGEISLEGKTTSWYNDIVPTVSSGYEDCAVPEITSGSWKLNTK